MKFVGRRGPLASLLLKNLLLTTVTIGFYRFWAKTRARRFLWSYTRILGEPLEYLGTGRELFIGFLIVVAILVPLAAIWSVITDFNIALSSSVFQPVALNAVYYLAVFLLIQVAVYRMWRYRLTRTVWRGVRFGLDGSSVQYAVRVCSRGRCFQWGHSVSRFPGIASASCVSSWGMPGLAAQTCSFAAVRGGYSQDG